MSETREWPNPTPEMLKDPTFNAIWNVIKSWDINVPDAYSDYCGATGNHVRAILDALPASIRAADEALPALQGHQSPRHPVAPIRDKKV